MKHHEKGSCPEELMPGIWAPAFEGMKTNCILYSLLFRPTHMLIFYVLQLLTFVDCILSFNN